jgi:hypothetical protein
MAPRDPLDDTDDANDRPEVTARPTGREADELLDEDGERLVPVSNVGGAAPTPLGMDSGGDPPGEGDELENLPEPEPPEAPEVGAMHVHRREPGK